MSNSKELLIYDFKSNESQIMNSIYSVYIDKVK